MLIIIGIVVIIFFITFAILLSKIDNEHQKNTYKQSYWEYKKNKKIEYEKAQQENFGKAGENIVADMLLTISQTHKAYVFNNFTFVDKNGFSTNIDHIFVCQGGVFVIETKANKGFIYGETDDEYWYAQKKRMATRQSIQKPCKSKPRAYKSLKKNVFE